MMADNGWFRILGGTRLKTPIKGTSETAEESTTAPTTQKLGGQGLGTRNYDVSSFLESFAGSSSPPLDQCQDHLLARCFTPENNDPPMLNESTHAWNNPSIDYMADSLLIAVMSSPVPKQIGPGHCSSLLHVLESYRLLKRRVSEVELHLRSETEKQKRQTNDFEALTKHWTDQEARYKAKIERLEKATKLGLGANLQPPMMSRTRACIGRGYTTTSSDENYPIEASELQNISKIDATRRPQSGRKRLKEPDLSHHPSVLGRQRILDSASDTSLSKALLTVSLREEMPAYNVIAGKSHESTASFSVCSSQTTIKRVASQAVDSESSSSSDDDSREACDHRTQSTLRRRRLSCDGRGP